MSSIILLGAGLSGALTALSIRRQHPHADVVLIDKKPNIGRTHTWSFHAADAPTWLCEIASYSWPRHHVCFFGSSRTFNTAYHTLFSDDLLRRVQETARLRLNADVTTCDQNSVTLQSGEVLFADVVIDARGFLSTAIQPAGYQKFYGITFEWEDPHGFQDPILMDVWGEQSCGFEFYYVLPVSKTRALVEWTAYSNSGEIDIALAESRISAYLGATHKQKLSNAKPMHCESGALPLPLHVEPYLSNYDGKAIHIGTGAGFYNFTTGYSLPVAIQIAEAIAGLQDLTTDAVAKTIEKYRKNLRSQRQFEALLNRMMFEASTSQERWKIFSRFYSLNPKLIERFYQGRLTLSDKARILIGRPPVPMHHAFRAAFLSRSSLCSV